jgi:hypothetical protein
MTVPAEIAASKQMSLTTYRKDGTPVPTAVWQVTEGDTLTTVSSADVWKVKRIRNNPVHAETSSTLVTALATKPSPTPRLSADRPGWGHRPRSPRPPLRPTPAPAQMG